MPDERIEKERKKINFLLRSKDFSIEIATVLSAAYGDEIKAATLADEEDKVTKTLKQEKIAMNLAGFYALECCIGFLYEQTITTPIEWLQKIVNSDIDSETLLLLNRFANATWKAGQPFRGLDRITRYNFMVAGYLPYEEVKKDINQITSAASMMLKHMHCTVDSPVLEQMKALRSLLQDTSFAITIASFTDFSYQTHRHQPVEAFLTQADETFIYKSAREQQIATNLAGFYALECGIDYLVTSKGLVPSDILRSIENNSVSDADKILFQRFANATWKAGQPFRDLSKITRDIFSPVYFLSKEDVEKDTVKIKAAARKLLQEMESID